MSSASGGALGGTMSAATARRPALVERLKGIHERLCSATTTLQRTTIAMHNGPTPLDKPGPTAVPAGVINLAEEILQQVERVCSYADELLREMHGDDGGY